MKIYYENFTCAEDVFNAFNVFGKDKEGIKFIYAAYDTPDYEGNAHVIYTQEGKLYEVNGSHCSCYGLEECWSPEETSISDLLARPNVAGAAKKNLKSKFLFKNNRLKKKVKKSK